MKTLPTHRRTSAERERPRHQEIHVNTLRLDSVLPFRLLTRIEGEYLLYRREELPFTGTQRNALLENGIEVLFVSPDEVEHYWNYLRCGIADLVEDSGPLETQAKTLYESSSQVTQQILDGPINQETISTARALVSECVRFQHLGKDALHALMSDMQTQPSIYHHSLNVCQFGLGLARHLGFNQQELEALGFGLLYQDIGMLQIPESIVFKNGPLSFEEWDTLKRHPSLSLEAINRVPGVSSASLEVIFHHHERIDGSGYPQGLQGDELSPLSRVAAVADVFTSLTTTRPFRTANNTFEALRIMTEDMNGELDTEALAAFIEVLGV